MHAQIKRSQFEFPGIRGSDFWNLCIVKSSVPVFLLLFISFIVYNVVFHFTFHVAFGNRYKVNQGYYNITKICISLCY